MNTWSSWCPSRWSNCGHKKMGGTKFFHGVGLLLGTHGQEAYYESECSIWCTDQEGEMARRFTWARSHGDCIKWTNFMSSAFVNCCLGYAQACERWSFECDQTHTWLDLKLHTKTSSMHSVLHNAWHQFEA
jgi:hypothetical protein